VSGNELIEKKFVWPYTERKNGTVISWSPGFIGNIGFGVAASVILWGLGAHELAWPKMLAMCFLGAMGAGNVIQNLIQQQKIDLQTTQIDVLSEAATGLGDLANKDSALPTLASPAHQPPADPLAPPPSA